MDSTDEPLCDVKESAEKSAVFSLAVEKLPYAKR